MLETPDAEARVRELVRIVEAAGHDADPNPSSPGFPPPFSPN
jgi:hypothetical protein